MLGAHVIACGRNEARLQALFGEREESGISTHVMDVTEAINFADVPDVIINAASPADPASFAHSPVQTMLSNFAGTQNVLDYALLHDGARILYVSSGEIYGYFENDHQVSENEMGSLDIASSRSCYPQSKRAAETSCASYVAQYVVDVRIARPSHILGPQFSDTDSRASAQFFRDALGGRAIELMSTGEQIRTFAYISDCVAGLLSIVSAGATGEAYNVTNSSTPTSFADFARFVGEAGKVPVRIPAKNETADNEPARPALCRVAQLSNAKLEALGWQPRFTAREAVDRTYTLLQLIR